MNTAQDGAMVGPQVWYGPEMQNQPQSWTCELDASHCEQIEAAVAHARASKKPLIALRQSDFPLGSLATVFAQLRDTLLQGRGFGLVRGLPVDALGHEGAAVAFWGIGAHLGLAVSQNGKGHVLGHVKDLGLDYNSPANRGYQTSARLPYHTDYADLVCLLCLKTAREGGLSSIVSSVTVYNEMLRQRPDLVAALQEPLYRTRWGEVGSDRPPWVEVPAFNVHADGIVTTYVRSAVRKAQLMPEVPRLKDIQVEAMDYFDSLAEDPALHLDMAFEPGDLQILNNHWVLHSRTAYEDHEAPADKRHLLRLWLTCEDGPYFPPAMTESFQGLTQNGRPNGIHVPGVNPSG
ncbi:MAG: hypothetical protein ACI9W2_000738 [Gammaproteobacteria bacterium]|jgi:hypothetical protein